MHILMHTKTHTHTKSKTYGSSYTPSEPEDPVKCRIRNNGIALGCLAPLRHSSLVQQNPPGAGLVTHRRTVQVSWIEIAESK